AGQSTQGQNWSRCCLARTRVQPRNWRREHGTSGCVSSDGGRVQEEANLPGEKPAPWSAESRRTGTPPAEASRPPQRREGGRVAGPSRPRAPRWPRQGAAPEAEPASGKAQAAWGAVAWLPRLPHAGGVGATAWGQGPATPRAKPSASHGARGGARATVSPA